MIGNDIVDLAQAGHDSNWQRRGFLEKLFTPHEQQLIHSATDPNMMVWLLWSMKESAYKAIVRQTERRFFAPQTLQCSGLSVGAETATGSVCHDKVWYRTNSSVTNQYVSTVASEANENQSIDEQVLTFERVDYAYQHRVIREAVKQRFASRCSVSQRQIEVQKNAAGVPSLVIQDGFGRTTNRMLSLSHHGQYGAFAIMD